MGDRRARWMKATLAAACVLSFAVPAASADSTVSVSFDPQNLRFDQPVTLTFWGTTDGPERLYAYYYGHYKTFGVCSADTVHYAGQTPNLLDGVPVTGLFSIPATPVTFPSVPDYYNGEYSVCVWLAGPGPETAVGTPQTIDFKVHRAPRPRPVATWLFSSFRLGAHGRELAVTSQVMAFSGGPPRGRCALEVYSASSYSWLYAKPQAHIDGHGRCRFSLEYGGRWRRRFRVRFVPALGFKASLGIPMWVGTRM